VAGREQKTNIQEQNQKTEEAMLSMLKDFMALVALCGFTATALTWMDAASRLV
jgi:hypothetical protein